MSEAYMREAIELAMENVRSGRGGPFAALVVRDGVVVGRGVNRVTAENDPTAHAEVMAIRDACRTVGDFQLTGCDLYTTCEPCPMCMGAIYWARPARVFFASTRDDAADAGFDDAYIYDQLARPLDDRQLPIHGLLRDEARKVFEAWSGSTARVAY